MIMRPFEIEDTLESAVILVDTREQDTPQLRARLATMGTYRREKLDFGDYSICCTLPDGKLFSLSDRVAIERKMSADELCNCYCRDRNRFEREFERAASANAKIYLLIERTTWEEIYAGNYRSRMNPKSLVASIDAWMARYNCQLLMCEPTTSGRLIRDVLYRELKEALERGDADEPVSAID